MIFSSPQFVLLFLPITFFCYFLLIRFRLIIASKAWLVGMSLIFYGSWNVKYLALLLGSILFNFAAGTGLSRKPAPGSRTYSRRVLLIGSITVNLALLGYYKYVNFLIDNINSVFHADFVVAQIILPLGISFFTFTQIAYLVDSYRGEVEEYDLLNYALFVTFFPHLIAGPILHHREMMSQFASRWTWAMRYRNIVRGLFLFSVGFCKKSIIADTFAIWANAGFDNNIPIDFFSGWAISLSYTFQLYFDFSGYCDMAMGVSLLFNIWLPLNFNSPYKALSIHDFWRRWHMTLSRYLRDYLYIPLGGNRCAATRMYVNILITFILGGLWHGASWMFVVWGALHGIALVIHRIWRSFGLVMPKAPAWLLTFCFINVTWVFFRANSMEDALRILRAMVDINSILDFPILFIPTDNLSWGGVFMDRLLDWLPVGLAGNILCFGTIIFALAIIGRRNSYELMMSGQNMAKMSGAMVLFCLAMYSTILTESTLFLYFNF